VNECLEDALVFVDEEYASLETAEETVQYQRIRCAV